MLRHGGEGQQEIGFLCLELQGGLKLEIQIWDLSLKR